MDNSPYQLRAGGAFDHNYGANHSIVSNDVAIQRPALQIKSDILASVMMQDVMHRQVGYIRPFQCARFRYFMEQQ